MKTFFQSCSRGIVVAVIFVGYIVLLGWILNVEILKSVISGGVTTKANSTIALFFSGGSLWLLRDEKTSFWRIQMGLMCALIVTLIGALTLSEYLFGWDLGIDQLLFQESREVVGTSHPGRMASATALNFLILGFVFLILNARRGYEGIAQGITLAVAFIALLALIGYLYDIPFLYTFTTDTHMAAPTSFAFLLLCLGILFTRPDRGLMAIVTSDTAGGVMARRLLPVAICLPIALGWLRLWCQRMGLFDPKFGFPFVIVSIVVLFVAVIWWDANLLYWLDLERKRAEAKARETAEIKSQFTSMVSHELRTPLTVVKEGIDIVLDGTAGPLNLNPEQQDFLEIAKRNIDRLSRLVNDVLDFQKLEYGSMDFNIASVDINGLVRESIEGFQSVAQKKGLELMSQLSEKLPSVVCDKDKITQVLVNLIGNAVKFTERGRVTVRTEGWDQRVRVEVQDQGPGIQEEDHPKLFQSFRQISTVEKGRPEGTGLGLAISKKIIESHGGQIGVRSKFGKGATFYFTLPVKEASQGV